MLLAYEQFKENPNGVIRKVGEHAFPTPASARWLDGKHIHPIREVLWGAGNFTPNSNPTRSGRETCALKKKEVPCRLHERLLNYYYPHNEVLFGIEPALRPWLSTPEECCRR